eukprot:jgi/Antlo1/425/913
MTSYTVQLFEDGKALCDAGLVQIPGEFTCEDLSEYVQKLTGTSCKFNFYIKGKLFRDTLEHMVSVTEQTSEDIVRIDYLLFRCELKPDYVLEFPNTVMALRVSKDGESLFITTHNRRLYKYSITSGFSPVFEQEIVDDIICLEASIQMVFGLSVSNKIWNLHTSEEIYNGGTMPITAFTKGNVLAVGFYDGTVKIQSEVVVTLESSIISIHCMEPSDEETLWIAAEAGHIVKYDLRTKRRAVTFIGTEITACCYFDMSLYLGTTEAKVVLVDAKSRVRTFDSTFYYIDWIFVNRNVCATSCFQTLHIQRPSDGTLCASSLHESQIVTVEGNENMLITGFGSYVYGFKNK